MKSVSYIETLTCRWYINQINCWPIQRYE